MMEVDEPEKSKVEKAAALENSYPKGVFVVLKTTLNNLVSHSKPMLLCSSEILPKSRLAWADIWSNKVMSKPNLIHEKGTKVVGLNCNPLQPDLLLSFGNDNFVYNNECYFGRDSSQSLVAVGRYIRENYGGAALHPIDFINISTGQLVAEVIDPKITTISLVNKLHPREDILASGSSSSLFIWRAKKPDIAQPREKRMFLCGEVSKKLSKKHGNNSDDDSDNYIFKSKDNGLEQKKLPSKSSYGSRKIYQL
ncbi:hypothetical protein T459_23283 [Capsicum annuum]|uniref:Uncharacterized protein n=1 Tax=Capsicum annuum TaxID=4072 RepID=A0A2G2YRW6_CAPAN|nr:hypothetical protein T459_23283 [Capsicum annuum]